MKKKVNPDIVIVNVSDISKADGENIPENTIMEECTSFDLEKFKGIKSANREKNYKHTIQFEKGKIVNDFFEEEEFQYKRFIVFAWDDNEGCGGLNDYQFCSDDAREAFDWVKHSKTLSVMEKYHYYQVFDRVAGKEVFID